MKALLVAVNAKYIHTSLSVRTLKAYANSDNVEMAEYTINERVEDILRSIFLKKADVVLFSCYIWNVEVCLDVADMLKKVSPETKIIFGGPEVSFDDTEYMQKYDFIDAIMRGEGGSWRYYSAHRCLCRRYQRTEDHIPGYTGT